MYFYLSLYVMKLYISCKYINIYIGCVDSGNISVFNGPEGKIDAPTSVVYENKVCRCLPVSPAYTISLPR